MISVAFFILILPFLIAAICLVRALRRLAIGVYDDKRHTKREDIAMLVVTSIITIVIMFVWWVCFTYPFSIY
ncbi:MAG: hypothetical protein J7621_09960 [Niastella sp.]|nr:hypothetical protein [Niastella sp.]